MTETTTRPGTMPSTQEQALAAKDKTLTSPVAVARAREALEEVTVAGSVGEHEAVAPVGERLVTHLFACTMPGYRGWRWSVTVARPPRGRTATVCEIVLLPGEDALLAPAWVPWADRLAPGDVTRADRLPFRETDERLEPGWEATGEDEGDAVALDELDLGRARVLSSEGVARAAQRWYDGEHGPEADGVRKAHAACSTCGFLMRIGGPMRGLFGICANEWAADDGRVVSLDHGCGAHSETDLPDQGPEWPVAPSRVDEADLDVLATDGASLRQGGAATDDGEAAGAEDPGAEEGAGAADDRAQDEAVTADNAGADGADGAVADGPQEQEQEQEQEQAEDSPAPKARRRSTKRAARPARDGERSRKVSTAVGEQPREETTGEADGQARTRHDLALDAVAELAAEHSRGAGSPSRPVPATLADLEAVLPSRL